MTASPRWPSRSQAPSGTARASLACGIKWIDRRWRLGHEGPFGQASPLRATSVGGTLTGRGADLIIVDDPLNANEVHSEPARKRVIDWYGGALVSRLND